MRRIELTFLELEAVARECAVGEGVNEVIGFDDDFARVEAVVHLGDDAGVIIDAAEERVLGHHEGFAGFGEIGEGGHGVKKALGDFARVDDVEDVGTWAELADAFKEAARAHHAVGEPDGFARMDGDGDAADEAIIEAVDAFGEVFQVFAGDGDGVAAGEDDFAEVRGGGGFFGLVKHVVDVGVGDKAFDIFAVFEVAVTAEAAAEVGEAEEDLVGVFLDPAGVLGDFADGVGELEGVPAFGAGILDFGFAGEGEFPEGIGGRALRRTFSDVVAPGCGKGIAEVGDGRSMIGGALVGDGGEQAAKFIDAADDFWISGSSAGAVMPSARKW